MGRAEAMLVATLAALASSAAARSCERLGPCRPCAPNDTSEACQTASHVQRWLCKEGDGSAEELFEPCRLESNWERGFKVVEFEALMVILLIVASVVATKRKRLHQRRHYQRLSTVLEEV